MSRKTASLFFIFILLLSIGILLFLQWNKFSSKQKKVKESHVVQNISIQHRNGKFLVEQTFQSLTNGVYEITWPSDAKNQKCYQENNRKCIQLGGKKEKIKATKGFIILKYEFKQNMESPSALLLENWYAQIDNLTIDSTKIQLSEQQFRNGTWLASSNKSALKRMEYIDYFVFERPGQAPSLYWQKEELKSLKMNKWLTVYYPSSVKIPAIKWFQLEKIKNSPPLAVVVTRQYQNTVSDSLIIMNNAIKGDIQERVTEEVIDRAFSFPTNEKWLEGTLVSAILSKPVGNEKAKAMYRELEAAIGKEKIRTWVEKLLSSNDPYINSRILDARIEEVTGLGTDFFEKNRLSNRPQAPIILFDTRQVKVMGEETKNLKLITNKGKRILSFVKIAQALGYEVKLNNGDNSIDLRKDDNHFQFFMDKNIFTYNGEEYGLLSTPLTKIGNEFFIELNWLNQLLNTKVVENENSIQVIAK